MQPSILFELIFVCISVEILESESEYSNTWRRMENTEVKTLPGVPEPIPVVALSERHCKYFCGVHKGAMACTYDATNGHCFTFETEFIILVENNYAISVMRSMNIFTYNVFCVCVLCVLRYTLYAVNVS